jgi:23S rRNA (pseudouridine1915-N3)-methyltransferase
VRIHLIAVGERMPRWVVQGYEEYARRLPPECALVLTEIPLPRRTKAASPARLRQLEGERMLAAVPRAAQVLALDERGREWDTPQLAHALRGWLQEGRDLALLVGGPDGLADSCRERAEGLWSLSRLTLPHPLVRVLVAEQLYRAWSILGNHPYHRG